MKILIAIINCHGRENFAKTQRETWIPQLKGADYKFFLGPGTRDALEDEVFLDCDDSYQGLPSKVRAVIRWSYEHGYDFVLKCDDDVILKPVELLNSEFKNFDFVGHENMDWGNVKTPWGFCYWLSRKAMQIVMHSELPPNNNDEAWVATYLHHQNIRLRHDHRYFLHYAHPTPNKRPLRAPKRVSPQRPTPEPDTFAYCVYIVWYGWHKAPEKVIQEEMVALFHKINQQYPPLSGERSKI